MKATLYDIFGKKKSELSLPKVFSTKVREDIVAKYYEADKFVQPYSPKDRAGLRQVASGIISHKRHDWKGHYGRGISRIPRKIMSRRGTQFYWVGANIPGARGGRRAHAPKGIGAEKTINKKEMELAFNSAFAATSHPELVAKRYATIEKISTIPAVVESLPAKTKPLKQMLSEIFSDAENIVFKKKEVRAGKGKLRGRKYKSNAGILIIVGKDEKRKMKGFDIKSKDEISISDLYPLGRLTLYTKKALEEFNAEESQ